MIQGEDDKPQTFAESALWDGQTTFYEEKGVEAWSARVPYHGTNNFNIASSAAEIAHGFMRDWCATSRTATDRFHMVELGTGVGRFGFYVIKALQELQEAEHHPIPFTYWMTDASTGVLEFLRTHAPIAELIKDGLIRLGVFDPTTQEPIREYGTDPSDLSRLIEVPAFETPPIAFANYFFDSLPVDILRLQQGRIDILTTSGLPNVDKEVDMNSMRALDDLGLSVEWLPVDFEMAGLKNRDSIIEPLAQISDEGFVIFPSAGLHTIDGLNRLCSEGFILMATDKALLPFDPPILQVEPKPALHGGAVSFNVNFPLIGRYFESLGGRVWAQETRQNLTSAVFRRHRGRNRPAQNKPCSTTCAGHQWARQPLQLVPVPLPSTGGYGDQSAHSELLS